MKRRSVKQRRTFKDVELTVLEVLKDALIEERERWQQQYEETLAVDPTNPDRYLKLGRVRGITTAIEHVEGMLSFSRDRD